MEYCRNLEKTIKAFWDGDGHSIDSAEGRAAAIKRATKDLMARTLTRKDDATEDFSKAVVMELLPQIDDWFGRDAGVITQDTFDDWHRQACSIVLDVLRAFYTNSDQDKTPVAYGKAQKIVNMTMKGLRCLEGANEKGSHFLYCHMALDSFTLEWFKRTIVEPSKRKLLKGKVDSWSALQNPDTAEYQRKDGKEYRSFYSYHTIVQLIRDHFAKEMPYEKLDPLHAEFFIWPEIQLAMAAEAFYGQDISSKDAVDYMMKHLKNKGDPDGWSNKINTATDKFQVCKTLFRTLSLGEKLEFLDNRIQEMKALYPAGTETAAHK